MHVTEKKRNRKNKIKRKRLKAMNRPLLEPFWTPKPKRKSVRIGEIKVCRDCHYWSQWRNKCQIYNSKADSRSCRQFLSKRVGG